MTRNGKISRLPRELRDELNRRLADGQCGKALLAWLNGLPQVTEVLNRDFGGVAISKQNLSEWRSGGLAEWQARQETLAQARELAADAREITAATEGRLTDHLATVLAARYAAALAGWNGELSETFRRQLRTLRGLCQDIVELRGVIIAARGCRWSRNGWSASGRKPRRKCWRISSNGRRIRRCAT